MEKVELKKDFKGILKESLIAFIGLQPLFDMYMGIVRDGLDIFGFSLATILRIVYVVLLTVIALFMFCKELYKESKSKEPNRSRIKKDNIFLMIFSSYTVLLLLYVILHHFNIECGNGYYITQKLYSFKTETAYVLRLAIPIYLILDVMMLKIKIKDLKEVLIYSFMIFSIVIVITNLFKVSYVAYSEENDLVNKNVIEWFTVGNDDFFSATSKGFFTYANEISAVLALSYPIIIYVALKDNKCQYYITVVLQFISMIMIGTRTAMYSSFGCIIIALILFSGYIILYRKQYFKREVFIGLVLIFGLVLYYKSPQMYRMDTSDYEVTYTNILSELIKKEENGEASEINIRTSKLRKILNDEISLRKYASDIGIINQLDFSYKDLKYEVMCIYISENYSNNLIPDNYILERYPYWDDAKFWLDVFDMPFSIKGDNRGRQIEITKRIFETSGSKTLNVFLGIGSTPLNQRGLMIERDYVAQYYQLGICGILLFVVPYIIIFSICGVVYLRIIIKRKKIFIDMNTIYIMSLAIMLLAAYVSGRVFEQYIVSFYGAVISGTLMVEYLEKSKEVKRIEEHIRNSTSI